MFKKVFVTGGSGDLGKLLISNFDCTRQAWVNYDLVSCSSKGTHFNGDICNQELMNEAMKGCDIVIHIAALHGIHELRGVSKEEFHRVNVKGTATVLESMRQNNVRKLVFLSSESVNKPESVYGQTKVECEMMISRFCFEQATQAVSLRCRSFVPSTNIAVYANPLEWLKYFAKGGVHVMDVVRSVLCGMQFLTNEYRNRNTIVTIDGKYEVAPNVLPICWEHYVKSLFKYEVPEMFLFLLESIPKIKVGRESYPNEIGYTPIFGLREAIEEVKHVQWTK
uniref:NAD(P)-dependent oxidoreductase n=1 Tax=Clandestinovirus TaxID=2831644 RepID=A0A8F8KTQ8_9VIRU|nr:NAD(P)-dependent oxidoreductase [Clandestinovirus]